MSGPTSHTGAMVEVDAFVASLLQREGGLAERHPDGALECVLSPELVRATGLDEAPRLRLLGPAQPGETALALESAALHWCLARATARGRFAAATLAPPAGGKTSGLTETVNERFAAQNGTLRPRATRVARLNMQVLEFRYQAIGEERTEGSVFVAFEPGLGVLSIPLAKELLRRLSLAEPAAVDADPAALAGTVSAVEPHLRRNLTELLAPFRERLTTRMARDAQRLTDYYQALLHEAGRRRRIASGQETSAAKVAAIQRQRDEKLRELAFRFAVEVRCELASLLVLDYPAPVCDVVFLRRKRELPLTLAWDPFLRDLLPLRCRGCGQPSLAFHACDEAGHLTCSRCATPCSKCARVTCRSCVAAGCRVCGVAKGE